jgi:Mrp family chromosome partitioning ATPase
VASASKTSAKAISRSVELLKQAGSPVVGTVLNRATGADTYGYSSKYDQYSSGGRGDANGSGGRRPPVFSRSSALPGYSSSATAEEGNESSGRSRSNDGE